MRVQIDRFEGNGMAVLLLYPEGQRSFDLPRGLLPQEPEPGDVFEVNFVHDRRETERMADDDKRLIDELLGRDG